MTKRSKLWDLKAWHWISSAVCLIGMLLFAITGITLNHAGSIESQAQVTQVEAQVPDAILTQLVNTNQREQLPHGFSSWYTQQTKQALAANAQVQWSDFELYVAMPNAGSDRWFTVALDTGEFYQEATDRGVMAYFNDLHKGRNTGIWWSLFLDLFSIACIVFSLTGLLLLKRYAKGRKSTWPLVLAGLGIPALILAIPAHAAEKSQLEVEIPRLTVAEYHPPYVAIWLADEQGKAVINLAHWYDTKMAEREGEKWLKDLRLWWRRSGRSLNLPVDGVTGATRRPGQVTLDLSPFKAEIAALPAGSYSLNIEAARELGGRELLRMPITLPIGESITLTEQGKHELGTITLTMEPNQ
ncbi:PepSY-associated TM helix domain-containing protein [Pseudoalteromonas sp. BDTF-M6]|uniref:PepSY-associated TM helix domain-containing protein n=1 Tax=Pseudoalteromonas sp. BDTF-M6 TaxID=2796132 RepID=UPI001BAEB241|nr:PepSY-associated TM helix domain-containing protein [Pseudoalteromonas sp. BDTF-M6]